MDYHPDLVSRWTKESPNLRCVRRAFELFHENFLYFSLVFLLPVLLGYAIHGAADSLARSALRGARYSGGTLLYPQIALVAALRWGGYGLVAVICGFVAGGITVVVRELRCGNQRLAFEQALELPRARLPTIASSALLQFFGLMFSIGVSVGLATYVVLKMDLPTSLFLSLLPGISWTGLALCLAVFGRWMLSVPVIIEEDIGTFASFRRSQELTAHYMPAMLLFVAHATIAGYLAGKIPYYAFHLIARHFTLPVWSTWFPFVLSFVFVAWTESLFAIGCAETYYAARESNARQLHQSLPFGE